MQVPQCTDRWPSTVATRKYSCSLSLSFKHLPYCTESKTWQKVVSNFLQRGLGYACLEKSLLLRNSNELIDSLETHHGRRCSVLSMDIKDPYYSLEKPRLMQRVRDALELNLVKFQSSSGISAESFLTVLEFYLKSTVVEYRRKKVYTKRCLYRDISRTNFSRCLLKLFGSCSAR